MRALALDVNGNFAKKSEGHLCEDPHSLRTCSSTGKPVEVVGLCSGCSSSGAVGFETHLNEMVDCGFLAYMPFVRAVRRLCHCDPPEHLLIDT